MSPPLSLQQKLAVQAPLEPLLIVAGAGTGKTLTLTSRLLYLIETGVPPQNICAITFTNKAAKEMAERIQKNWAPDKKGTQIKTTPFVGTFHSLGARILRAEGYFFGRTPAFSIFDDDDSLRLIRQIAKLSEDPSGQKTKKDEEGPRVLCKKISDIKNGDIPLEKLKQSPDPKDQFKLKLFQKYEQALRRNNAFDFDDLIEKVVRLLKKFPAILKKYRSKYRHILIDEYQDLNLIQYELVKILAGEIVSGERSLSVVGDDHQMIYSWRGSKMDIFLNFEKEWEGAQVALLEESYRSSGHIVMAASALIGHNRSQRAKVLWTRNPVGAPIVLRENEDESDEAKWIANELEEKGVTTAILYRTNAQSRAIEQALMGADIPYQIFGGLRFYDRREVRDVVAAIRYAVNPQDLVAKDRLLTNLRKSRFSDMETALANTKDKNPLALIRSFLDATNYLKLLETHFPNHEERKENIASLMEFASEFETAEPLLERVALLQTSDLPEKNLLSSSTPVKLMTIHLAKGLEFDHVFVAGASEGLLPHARSMSNEEALEEERRLMYVAMTRARKKLALCFYNIPSRFLFELPPEHLLFYKGGEEASVLSDEEERYITLD